MRQDVWYIYAIEFARFLGHTIVASRSPVDTRMSSNHLHSSTLYEHVSWPDKIKSQKIASSTQLWITNNGYG